MSLQFIGESTADQRFGRPCDFYINLLKLVSVLFLEKKQTVLELTLHTMNENTFHLLFILIVIK
jgi:hypothetical protein